MSLLQCRRAVGPNWGLTPKTCSWIYERAIRPILTYASTIWINAILKQRNQKLLTKVERIALKMITGCMPSTPTIALNQITNMPTIIHFIEGEAAKGHLRLQATKQLTSERPTKTKGTIISHTYQNFNYINTLKLPQGENDMMKKRLNLNLRFKTIISNRDQNAEYLKSIKDITCYTDGSKIGTQTGYGYRISKNNNTITSNEESGRMPSHCTVYQAEVRAVTEAAKHLKHVNIINKNRQIIKTEVGLIFFVWIFFFTFTLLILLIVFNKKNLRRAIKNNMNHIVTTKHLKNNRKELRIATQFITGHIGLNYHLHKINRSETAMCESCELEEETVEHFIGRCPTYHMLRQKYLNTFSDTLDRQILDRF